MLEPFGPNVVSTDGDLWRFHLRITLPPFGEAVQQLVWDETERQTGMMAASWAKSSGAGSLKHNIYTLTVNTMSLAGFGRQADWVEDSKAVPQGHSLSLVAAIFGVVMHLPHILLMPKWLLRNSPWKIAHTAYVEFEQYMNELLAEAKAGLQRGVKTESGAARENLLTAVLRSSEEGAKQAVAGPGGRTSLTDEEIKGNVFIFLLAGK
jgi:cytochrome P450